MASRGDVLGSLLVLLTLFFYWRSRFLWALLTYALALFSKESALLLPTYLILLDLAFIKSDLKTLIRRALPFVLLTAAFVIYRKFFCPVPLGPPSNNAVEGCLRVL